jgi:hypothetical protein
MDVSDDEDNYFDKIQEHIDSQPDNDDVVQSTLETFGQYERLEGDEEYYQRMIQENSSSERSLPENDLIWQILMRKAVASSNQASTESCNLHRILITQSSSILILQQWLFSHLPLSSKLYCMLRFPYDHDPETSQIWVDDTLHPSTIMIITHIPVDAHVSIFSIHNKQSPEIISCAKLLRDLLKRNICIGSYELEALDSSISDELLSELVPKVLNNRNIIESYPFGLYVLDDPSTLRIMIDESCLPEDYELCSLTYALLFVSPFFV